MRTKQKEIKISKCCLNSKEQQLQRRLERLEAAFVEAMSWLSQHAPGRAYLVLQDALKNDK